MNKEKKDLLVFGYGLAIIALIFALGGIHRHGMSWAPLTLLACSAVFAAVTALDWKALRPGYKGWMKVAHLIGGVVTTVILGAVFFLLFAPIGIVFRLVGKDHLERKIEPSRASYWHIRDISIDKERYKDQF